MTSMADRLGFGPKRELRDEPDGGVTVLVTPPTFMGGRTVSVKLTAAQREGYTRWQNGELIQCALPGLSVEDREKLMSGLDNAAWNEHVIGEDE